MFWKILFKLTKWLIRKYFKSDLRAVMGTKEKDKIVAWQWTFIDEKYEKERDRKIIKHTCYDCKYCTLSSYIYEIYYECEKEKFTFCLFPKEHSSCEYWEEKK